jgi:hypothetical protein
MKRIICFLLICLLPVAIGFSQASDFGLTLDQKAGFSGNGDGSSRDGAFDYSGILIPHFSTFWNGTDSLFISAGLRADYLDKEWLILPELLRTELSIRFGGGASKAARIQLGRLQYSDPLGYIADGLFDGGRFSYDAAFGTLGAEAFYTGLLYKNRADIAMTAKDAERLGKKLSYSDFADTYFAPSRFLAALDWSHPSIAEVLKANFAFLGQFDLTGENLNSQYLVGKAALPLSPFILSLGGCLEFIQDDGDSGAAYSGDLGAAWDLPFSLKSRLLFLARYTSASNGGIEAFLPITTKSQGFVFKANYSGVTLFSLDYSARVHETCSLSLSSAYFIRNGKAEYSHLGDKGSLLGNEFMAAIIWNPLSDMRFNLGGGFFLPSMGNVAPDAKPLWRIELNAIISVY